jgi:hypothetical protein
MGYPFFINPQSAFFYPPLWFFVVTGIPITSSSCHCAGAASFLGACGVYLLVRLFTSDWRCALFGAVAYQFFGGFYSNAEHPDIVRAYSWLPWLFWAATLRGTLALRNYFLPVIIFCAVSGSYPGNIGSHIFFTGLYIFGQLYQPGNRSPARAQVLTIVRLLALAGLGLLLCTVIVTPPLLLRRYLYHVTANLPPGNWPFQNWLSLITPWTIDHHAIGGFTGDGSMISALLECQWLLLLYFYQERAFGPCCFVVYAAGWPAARPWKSSLFYQAAVRVLPVLGLSRFPSSDYRAIIALSLIVLACCSLKHLFDSAMFNRRALRRRLLWTCFVPIVVLS